MATTPQVSVGGHAPKPTAAVAQVRPPFLIETPQVRKHFLSLLVYGEYGVGKTTLAGSACEVASMQDVFLVDAEAGDLTLSGTSNAPDRVRVTDFSTTARVYEYLKIHCSLRDQWVDHKNEEAFNKLCNMEANLKGITDEEVKDTGPKLYRTCIIDSLSEVETYNMYGQLGIRDSTRMDDEVASAEWSEYKKLNTTMQRLVRGYRDLPMHVVMCCAAQYDQDEHKKYKYKPALTGKLSKQVQGFMDMVGFMVVGTPVADQATGEMKVVRRLYVSPSTEGRYDAKHRYSAFKGYHFDDPTIGSILEATGLTHMI